jgi:predicted DNA binding protein
VATFRGESGPLRRVLGRLKSEGLPFTILRTSQRTTPPDTEEGLTRRQRAVLERAWLLGYFAVPRRISLTRLSKLTGQSPPALGKMLRRAERWLVPRYLHRESLPAPGSPERAAAASASES